MASVAQSALLRCVSFYLLHGWMVSGSRGPGPALPQRVEVAIREFQQIKADIIGLQEASTGKGRGSVAAQVAARLGLAYVYAPASCRVFPSARFHSLVARVMNFTEGPALLSRFPFAAWRVYELPSGRRVTEPRVLLTASLHTPWGLLPVAVTYTSGVAAQHRTLAMHVQAQSYALPLLLLGDLNAVEETEAMTVLTQGAGLIDTFRAVHPTAPGYTSDQALALPAATVTQRIDYVLMASGSASPGRLCSSQVILQTPNHFPNGRTLWPSDHYGVLTEITLG